MMLKRLFLIPVVFCLTVFFSGSVAAQEEASPWSHESELGVALAGGNTDSKTVNFKQKTGYEWAKNTITINTLFLYSFADGTTTAKSWLGGIRYEREINRRFSAFMGHSWEGDIYAGYDYKANGDIGGKYFIFPGDKKKRYFLSEAGYRFAYENKSDINGIPVPETQNYHFLRIYFEAAKDLTEFLFTKTWIEFLPDLTDKNNFQISFEPSLGVTLTKYLSLKLSYLGKFDNVPSQAGFKKYDWLYLTALVARF